MLAHAPSFLKEAYVRGALTLIQNPENCHSRGALVDIGLFKRYNIVEKSGEREVGRNEKNAKNSKASFAKKHGDRQHPFL